MSAACDVAQWKTAIVWIVLPVYLLARITQLWAERLPPLYIVVLHVVPPALFAVVHGSIVYSRKSILVFTAFCLGFGAFFESLSLRTGFPFGHYYFTSVMGPKVFGLPVLLVFAYLRIGYCSWILAVLTLACREENGGGWRLVATPALAAFIMLAWDVAMDPQWAAIDHAWVWLDGGAYLGVPFSNFFGWLLTAYLIFQAFALYCRAQPARRFASRRGFWQAPILMHTICAAGNLLIRVFPTTPAIFVDAAGREWYTASIL